MPAVAEEPADAAIVKQDVSSETESVLTVEESANLDETETDQSESVVVPEAEASAPATVGGDVASVPATLEDSIPVVETTPVAKLYAMGHVQNSGWAKDYTLATSSDSANAATIGNPGSGLRLEALRFYLDIDGKQYGVIAKVHVQNAGWMNAVSAQKADVGTTGRALRIEAIQLSLPDELKSTYSLEYRVYVQGQGWLDWTKDGASAGSQGYALRMEAIQFRLVAKDTPDVPSTGSSAFLQPVFTATSHVQNIGWQTVKSDPKSYSVTLGTTGRALRLEAFTLSVAGLGNGGVSYSAHVQNIGWQNAVSNGATIGTTGRCLRIEAVKLSLTGDLATKYDIYYRAHVQNVGWMGWAKNGEVAGTSGCARRLEALQIVLVPKGSAAPGSTAVASIVYGQTVTGKVGYQTKGATAFSSTGLSGTAGTTGKSLPLTGLSISLADSQSIGGGISYKGHFANKGWTSEVSNGAELTAAGNQLEAIQIRLTGGYATYYDVYYRVHVGGYGWTGWAKNGASCGSEGCSRRVEAYQVVLVPKYCAAPGSTSNTFSNSTGFLRPVYSSGNAQLDSYLKTIVSTKTGTGSDALRKAFDYVAYSFTYKTINGSPSGNWKVNYALEFYQNKSGNCYRFSALFYQLARYLGYEARLVPGSVVTKSDPKAPHCWVEVKMDGTWYVFDPDMQNAYYNRGSNWFKMSYGNAPVTYNYQNVTYVY